MTVNNIRQQRYTSKAKGLTYTFQTPASNVKTLEIMDSMEVMQGGVVMSSSFPLILETVVIQPQDLTVDSPNFQGKDGIQELIEVCSQAVSFLVRGDTTQGEASGQADKSQIVEGGTAEIKS